MLENKDLMIELYKKMYLIRKSEEVISDNYLDDEMKTPMHMCKGSEAISVGVISALGDRGQYFSTYRSHGPYLASGGDINKFFAEMYGKETGRYAGKSGSMHISSPETGHISSSAIVASNIPVAVGAAWANKMKGSDKIVVVFFGDGATDAGNFWESINMACLWELPIIFICEDNRMAVNTPSQDRQGYNDIFDCVSGFKIKATSCSGIDSHYIYNIIKQSMEEIDKKCSPQFFKFGYFRFLEHVGTNSDIDEEYRHKDCWFIYGDDVDPVSILREKIMKKNINVEFIENKILDKIYNALSFAKNSKFSNVVEVYKNVFYG